MMKTSMRYATAFGVGSLAGIANELIQNPNHWCLDSPNVKALATISIGNVYGWSALIALVYFEMMREVFPRISNGIVLVIMGTVLVSLAEGVFGQISKRFHNGKKTWQYPECWVPMFDGYVSVVSSLFFGVGVAIFYWFLYEPYLAQ